MFSTNGGGCMGHMAGGGGAGLGPALKQLYDEHPGLRSQMELMVQKAKLLATAPELDLPARLDEMAMLESKFKSDLDVHSEKEEGGLFPMLGRYIGTETGPIAVMEHEHSEAKRLLGVFESLAANRNGQSDRDAAMSMAAPLVQACNVLFDHFMKEENVLFPMAERALSEQEKAELLKIVQGK